MREGQPLNIKVEVTLTDQFGSRPPLVRTMSVVTADGESAMVRHDPIAQVAGALSLDAQARVVEQGRLRVRLAIDYTSPESGSGAEGTPRHQVRGRQDLVLTSGTPTVIAESVDPASSRRVVVEVKATILK